MIGSPGNRAGVKDKALLITDGHPTKGKEREEAIPRAKDVKQAGVQVKTNSAFNLMNFVDSASYIFQ